MKDTDSYEADVPVVNLAEGYTRNWDDVERTSGPRRRNIYTRPARGSAAGGGYSTAPDLLRFTEALVGDKLLSPPYTDWILTGAEPRQGQGGRAGAPAGGGLGIAGGAPGINAALEFDVATRRYHHRNVQLRSSRRHGDSEEGPPHHRRHQEVGPVCQTGP